MGWLGDIFSGEVDAVPFLDNPLNNDAAVQTTPEQRKTASGEWWKGSNGRIYYRDPFDNYQIKDLGDSRTVNTSLLGSQIADPNTGKARTGKPSSNGVGNGIGATGAAPKALDEAQLRSIDSLLASLDADRATAKAQALMRRDEQKRKKEQEREREKGEYEGKKVSVLQDFAGAKTETDLGTRDTLENLKSSLSTLGLAGSRNLVRQILNAANKSNRKANATQAKDNQGLDSAWNEFDGTTKDDLLKIEDQYGHDVGEADRSWGKERRNALYKKAEVYDNANRAAERAQLMGEGDALNPVINQATFMNPQYTGVARDMNTPELSDYVQDVARYDTSAVGADAAGVTPVGIGAAPGATPGNLAVKAIAVNDKDLGVKKKQEGVDPILGV